MKRRSKHVVRGKQLTVLASARRLELVEALMGEQPATVEELGRCLGRDPKTLYHHLRPLVAAGLVEEAGERPTTKRPAKLYRLPAEQLVIDFEDDSRAARDLRRKMSRSVLRYALKAQELAIEHPSSELGGGERNASLGHRIVRLRPREVRRLKKRLREVLEEAGAMSDERGRPYAITLSLAPTSSED